VIATRTAQLGADHLDTLTSKDNLAILYDDQRKYDWAEPLHRKAVEGARARLGLAHPNTQLYIRNLIACYEKMGRPVQGEPLLCELADFWKQKAGADSPQYAGQLAALGSNLLRQRKFTDAEPVLRDCLAIREKKQPEEWNTFIAKSLLGGAVLNASTR
jgi:serine/threonine-protein kinase